MQAPKFEPCELYTMIPREKIEKIFMESKTASAELDYTFLGFEEVYKAVTLFVPKNKIILDLGCGYAFQAWYFKDYRKYIGVNVSTACECVLNILETGNSDFYHMTIQDFIRQYVREEREGFCEIRLPGMEPQSIENVFAICSYVPGENVRKLVRETFPYCLVYYPVGIGWR